MRNNKIYWMLAIAFIAAGFLFWVAGRSHADVPVCGNARVEGYEECDNGEVNSDLAPDACRTNCVLPRCGDDVTDSGEQCDNGGSGNSNQIPNACRTDCRKAHCGDGVLDSGEECDDANEDPYDGCHQCQRCYLPKDDLVLSAANAKVRLCPGRYEFTDSGQEGIIIIAGPGMIVDCSNAILAGKPVRMATQAQMKTSAAATVLRQQGSTKKEMPQQDTQTPATQPPATPRPQIPTQTAVLAQGVGIVIQSPDVVLHNCVLERFKTGIKLKSTGAVLFNDRVCTNTTDIVSEKPGNFGVKNVCISNQNWMENGNPACTLGCGN